LIAKAARSSGEGAVGSRSPVRVPEHPPAEQTLSLKKSLGLVGEKAGTDTLKGKSQDVRDVQRQALWFVQQHSGLPFRDAAALDYHGLVAWVAGKADVDQKLSTGQRPLLWNANSRGSCSPNSGTSWTRSSGWNC